MSRRFDVAVIGGGIVGASAGYHLARAGASVVLLERSRIAAGASGRNAGTLHGQLESRMLDEPPEKLARFLALSRQALARWRTLEDELGADLGVMQRGGLVVAQGEADDALLRHKSAVEQAAGAVNEVVTGDAARRLCPGLPPSITAASLCVAEGRVDPRAATLGFVAAAEGLGLSVRTAFDVVRLRRVAGGWSIEASPGDVVRAREIVLSAGVWNTGLASMVGATLPSRSIGLQYLVTEPVGARLDLVLQHVSQKLTLKQDAAGSFIVGGGHRSRGPAGGADAASRPSVDATNAETSWSTATAVFPPLRGAEIRERRAAIAPLTPDHGELVGRLSAHEDVHVCMAEHGVTLAPVVGAMLVGQMLRRDGPIVDAP